MTPLLHDPFPAVELPPVGTNSVHIREGVLPGDRWSVRCVLTNDYPDGALLDDPIATDGMFVLWRVGVDEDGRSVIRLNSAALGVAPKIWYVMLPELDASRPAMSIVGFPTDHLPEGTIVTDPMFFSMPVDNDEQVGAVRWWFEEGVIDQVYVDPNWRRQGVATELLYAVGAWQALHGWPVDIRSDGRRTELGQHLDAATMFPQRFAPIAEVSPPMDLPEL